MATLQQIYPALKDADGNSIMCQCGCRRVARHVHHINRRCQGGTNHPNNLLAVCQKCHVAIHSQAGDFARWGKLGGEITAQTGKSYRNLKQFQGADGEARWIAYCERKANAQMGVQ